VFPKGGNDVPVSKSARQPTGQIISRIKKNTICFDNNKGTKKGVESSSNQLLWLSIGYVESQSQWKYVRACACASDNNVKGKQKARLCVYDMQ
jgi:hypothetical protein